MQRQYVCPKDGKVLNRDDLIRGYEMNDGTLLTVHDDELTALAPDKTTDIMLKEFVRIEDVPISHFDRPYFLVPIGSSLRPYHLLARVMEDRGRAGIGTFVVRDKEYLIAILAEYGFLVAETLRFADEIRSPKDLGLPQPEPPSPKKVKQFAASIKSLSRKSLNKTELNDTYAGALQRLVGKKRKSREDVVQLDTDEDAEPENVVDLVAVFRERMRQASRVDQPSLDTSDLSDLSKDELYRRAQARKIPGRSKMSKEQLVQALSA